MGKIHLSHYTLYNESKHNILALELAKLFHGAIELCSRNWRVSGQHNPKFGGYHSLDSGHCLHQIQQHRKMSFGYILQKPNSVRPQTPHAQLYLLRCHVICKNNRVVRASHLISSPAPVLLNIWPCKNIFHIQV